jgi:hypothetical protein
VTLKPLGALPKGARRPVRALFTERGQPGTLWAEILDGVLFAGRFE